MDSITQIALGAAMGETVAGKQAGNRAMLWGALAGTIPDLDILLNPFFDPVDQLAMHRGLSHSFFFAILAAPVFGWLFWQADRRLAARRRRKFPDSPDSPGWKTFSVLAAVAFITHVLLDYLTIYGTQLFQPFNDTPAALGSVCIIDLLYTVPLLIGLLGCAFAGFPDNDAARRKRVLFNSAGVAISTAYLCFGIFAKGEATKAFEREFAQQGIQYEQLFTGPMPLNTILWMALAQDTQNDQLHVALYSFFDDLSGTPMLIRTLPRHSQKLAGQEDTRTLKRLFWFSRGYYTVSQDAEGALVFNDLRFGRSDGWLTNDGFAIFAFRLLEDAAGSGAIVGFERQDFVSHGPRGMSMSTQLRLLWQRLLGNRLELKTGS